LNGTVIIKVTKLVCEFNWKKGDALNKRSGKSTVYQGIDMNTGKIIAIKEVKVCENVEKEFNALRKEVDKLKRLEHQNIIKYLHVDIAPDSPDKKTIEILLEYMPGGSVRNLLDKFGPLDEKIIKIYMRQVLEGLKYLHGRNIVHNNLKCSNILVATEGNIKLSDFAMTKCIFEPKIKPLKENTCENTDRAAEDETLKNSLFWMAPEVIENAKGDKAADVWSLGCVMVEMRTGNPPWMESDSEPSKILEKIAHSPDGPELPDDNLSPLARSWLKRCFERRPECRPTIKELQTDPFIVQSDDMQARQLMNKISTMLNDDMVDSDMIPEERKSINTKGLYGSNLSKAVSTVCEEVTISKTTKEIEIPAVMQSNELKPLDTETKAKEERRKKLEEALLQELERIKQKQK